MWFLSLCVRVYGYVMFYASVAQPCPESFKEFLGRGGGTGGLVKLMSTVRCCGTPGAGCINEGPGNFMLTGGMTNINVVATNIATSRREEYGFLRCVALG